MDNSGIGFKLPDLIIESVLREGFAILRKNPQHIESIMAQLKVSYLEKKWRYNTLSSYLGQGS